ncbi:hypothetical protein M501DRAFT_985962 [Patellaria atrata CBS 101060]|uniref:Uncharacterized protein n=1 Tax=Patellaria atrata CBS 101060 TaxID=1346257 RepID=A0A9P4VQE7_9PEZI|nr:hypothetical protein M501DRAFT_985962 [Patellaria atrata CBS 101060]
MKFSTAISIALTTFSLAQASPIELEERSGTPLTQAQAASRLTNAGISSYSSGGCTTRSVKTCTSYEGVLSGTVDGAITLKGACGCSLVITGGTEVGHADGPYSHYKGYKFDFRKNTALDSYVKNSFTRIANRGDGYPQWQSAAGNIYCDEGNHWDVTYY